MARRGGRRVGAEVAGQDIPGFSAISATLQSLCHVAPPLHVLYASAHVQASRHGHTGLATEPGYAHPTSVGPPRVAQLTSRGFNNRGCCPPQRFSRPPRRFPYAKRLRDGGHAASAGGFSTPGRQPLDRLTALLENPP